MHNLNWNTTSIIAVAPKVYGGILEDGSELVKVKGYKNKISFDFLKSLLNKNSSLELNQDKWYRNLIFGNIVIKDEDYHLVATENKRKLIYQNDEGTEPFIINSDKEIINK